jgi:hypothetical protein
MLAVSYLLWLELRGHLIIEEARIVEDKGPEGGKLRLLVLVEKA